MIWYLKKAYHIEPSDIDSIITTTVVHMWPKSQIDGITVESVF